MEWSVSGEVWGGEAPAEDGVVQVVAAHQTQLPHAIAEPTEHAHLKHGAPLQLSEADSTAVQNTRRPLLLLPVLPCHTHHDAVSVEKVGNVGVEADELGRCDEGAEIGRGEEGSAGEELLHLWRVVDAAEILGRDGAVLATGRSHVVCR